MHLKLFFFAILFSSASSNALAQTRSFSNELKFAQYLYDKQLYNEAVFVLQQQDTTALSLTEKDSLLYQLGWLFYNQKQLDASAAYLLRVLPQSSYYLKARSFAAYNLTYLKKTDSAKEVIKDISASDTVIHELKSFQLAGIALLEKDYPLFKQLKDSFTYSSYALTMQEKNLAQYYTDLSIHKKKSPVLAGLYSAAIPGLGKIYAGKKKQGIGAFLPVASLGVLTYEAYRKGGIKSARFIIFGSLFSIFYAGNIWGSVVSVNIIENEFYHDYENKVLLDLHIPLRSIFN